MSRSEAFHCFTRLSSHAPVIKIPSILKNEDTVRYTAHKNAKDIEGGEGRSGPGSGVTQELLGRWMDGRLLRGGAAPVETATRRRGSVSP